MRLLSKSGVAAELRYFGPSPSRRRPPRPTAWPDASRIGKITRLRNLSYDALATVGTRRGEAHLDELLGADVALRLERAGHLVPAARRPAELEGLDRGVGDAAAVDVVEGGGAGLRRGQDRVVEGDRVVEDLAEPGLVGVLALGPLVDLDAGALGEGAERLGEGRAVALHDEAEDVAAQAAAEAVPVLAGRGDDERGCLLTVEGAQALVGGARLLERHRLADDLDDRQLALDLRRDSDRQMAPPGSHPTGRPATPDRPVRPPRQAPDMTVGLSSLDKPCW